MRSLLVLVSLSLGFLSLATRSSAVPITFIFTGSGSGSLGGDAFDAAFTITAVADTDNRYMIGSNAYAIQNDSVTIDISGVGLLTFIDETKSFFNTAINLPGFSRYPSDDLFHGPGGDPALAGWDLTTSIGPIYGEVRLLQWSMDPTLTTGGNLLFENGFSNGSFQAIADHSNDNTVPDHSSTLALLGAAAAGLAIVRRGCAAAR